MSGFTDIDGSTVMAGSPPLQFVAEFELKERVAGIPSVRKIAALTVTHECEAIIVAGARSAVRLYDAGEHKEALSVFKAAEKLNRYWVARQEPPQP